MEQNDEKKGNAFCIELSFSRVELRREKGKVREVPLWKHGTLDERVKRFARFLKRDSSAPKRPLFYKQPNVILGCVHHLRIPGILREICHLNFSVRFFDQSTKFIFSYIKKKKKRMLMIFARTNRQRKDKVEI